MTALIVVLMFAAFVAIDFFVREASRRLHEKRARLEREEVLKVAVRLDFTHEAKSLKRVEVADPKARILAVDDEPVVLDSFRRILVLEGYNVDTVETGPEALGLVQSRDYDFVFTDMKMPDMDGVEVVKSVKHFRPDVDVVVITGYGTIETAVQTLQHGACEYVQKPFTAEELAEFMRKLLIKRQSRLDALKQPAVRLVSPRLADTVPPQDYCVPGGAFVAKTHAWARIEPEGLVRIGLDDFARKALGKIDAVELPELGSVLRRGEPLFRLRRGDLVIHVPSPLSGKVEKLNDHLSDEPARMMESPYERGWACVLQPSELASELGALRIGQPVADWYQEEIARLRKAFAEKSAGAVDWAAFEQQFLAE